MSKLHFSLFLLCLSIAVCSAGVLPRASNELQNDLPNLEVASEKDVSEFGGDGKRAKKNVEPKATNSSIDVSESETTKIEEVLNITNVFGALDGAGQEKGTSPESDEKSGESQSSTIEVPNESNSRTSELKDVENSDFKTTNLESVIKSTSDKISNDTEELKWHLKELLNETTDNTQVSRSQTNNSEFLLPSEEIEISQGGNKTDVSEILDASFSLLPNKTIEFDNVNNTGNSSSIKELEIFLNETEVIDAGYFNNSEFIEEIDLSINITGDGEELFRSAVIKTDNSSDLMNDTKAFWNANFSGNFSSFEERNASSIAISNDTETNLPDQLNSLEEHNSSFTAFSNDTENLSNITDIDVTNITSLSFSNITELKDNTEGNSLELEPDSFTLNETEVNGINTEIETDSENLSVESDAENTPIEGSFLTNEKESEGLFSNFGFDFLKNSQIAKNAAKAMEIFNLSDSITDHMIEEHELHSFLDAAPVSAESVDVVVPVKLPQEKIDPSIFNIDASPEGLKTLDEKTDVKGFEDKTSIVNEISDIEGVTLLNDELMPLNDTIMNDELMPLNDTIMNDELMPLNDTVMNDELIPLNDELIPLNNTILNDELIQLNNTMDSAQSSSNLTKPDFNNTDEANLQSNSSESTAGFNETMPQITNSTSSIPDVKVNNTTASPKCPPPGVCIFWFLAQDTCALNSHCLGTRICCKIRCSKTCIEV